jgi:glycosyltransferase involved in cell wall biosynthesis
MAYPLFHHWRGLAGDKRPVLVNHIHGLSIYDHAANMGEALLGHFPVSAAYRAVTGRFAVRWDSRGVEVADATNVQNNRDLAELAALRRDFEVACIPAAVHPELLAASAVIAPVNERQPGQVLWFGTWESRKGSWYVPEAFRIARAARPTTRLIIGGTGRSQSDVARYFAEEDRDAVTVLPRVTRAEQIDLMNKSELFLFPSLSEGFGLALPEAMSFGLAAVATGTGFAADHLVDRVHARVVATSSEHLGRAMLELLSDSELRARVGMQGRDVARSFTPERMVDGYERLFERLVATRKSMLA